MKQVQAWLPGIILTLILAAAARLLVQLPYLNILGPMVVAIIIGMVWRTSIGFPDKFQPGISFSGKKLLRLGIIIMGVRLNFQDVIAVGPKILFLDALVIVFAITLINWLGKRARLEGKLGTLVAVGTGVCGAAAIAAVAPLIQAKEEETAVSIAVIAILGTIFTIAYSLLYPFLGISQYAYGVFSGSTLHEVAHVIAAAAAGGAVSRDIAILVKLGRVALLIPVALILGALFTREAGAKVNLKNLPVPWFLFGFLGVSLLTTWGIIPQGAVAALVSLSVFILIMAMGGIGLGVELSSFGRLGKIGLRVGIVGSIFLSLVGMLFLRIFNFA